jgi:hypothetical protein
VSLGGNRSGGGVDTGPGVVGSGRALVAVGGADGVVVAGLAFGGDGPEAEAGGDVGGGDLEVGVPARFEGVEGGGSDDDGVVALEARDDVIGQGAPAGDVVELGLAVDPLAGGVAVAGFAAELEADAAVALRGREDLGVALDDLAFDDAGEVHDVDSLSDGG